MRNDKDYAALAAIGPKTWLYKPHSLAYGLTSQFCKNVRLWLFNTVLLTNTLMSHIK